MKHEYQEEKIKTSAAKSNEKEIFKIESINLLNYAFKHHHQDIIA
jgi:hypothetical protein